MQLPGAVGPAVPVQVGQPQQGLGLLEGDVHYPIRRPLYQSPTDRQPRPLPRFSFHQPQESPASLVDEQPIAPPQRIDPLQLQLHPLVERLPILLHADERQRQLVVGIARSPHVQPLGGRQRAEIPRHGLCVWQAHATGADSFHPAVPRHIHPPTAGIPHHFEQPFHRHSRHFLDLVPVTQPNPLLQRRPAPLHRQPPDPPPGRVGNHHASFGPGHPHRPPEIFADHPQHPFGIHVHQPTVVAVRCEDPAGAVRQHARWPGQLRLLRVHPVPAATRFSRTRDRPQPAVPSQPVHPVPARIGDHQPFPLVQLHIHRQHQGQLQCGSDPFDRCHPPASGHGRDPPIRSHPPHPAVSRVGDIQIPFRVESQTRRIPQLRFGCLPAVTAPTRLPGSRDPFDNPIRPYPPHQVIAFIGDIQIPFRVESQTRRIPQLRFGCLPAVTAPTRLPGSRDPFDNPIRPHPPH